MKQPFATSRWLIFLQGTYSIRTQGNIYQTETVNVEPLKKLPVVLQLDLLICTQTENGIVQTSMYHTFRSKTQLFKKLSLKDNSFKVFIGFIDL